MRPYVPNAFFTGENLDLEKLNDNLEHIARDHNNSVSRRYTYSHARLDLDGVTEASAAVLREIAIRRPATSSAIEVYAVEVVIYAAGTEVWTLACSDTSWPSITVTAAGSTTEASASSGIPVPIPSESADVTFTMSAGAASTITRGYIVVHFRCDRGNQGDALAEYFPDLLTSATSAVGTTLDSELENLEAAIANDTAADDDLRIEVYSIRNLAAGSNMSFRAPSGARVIKRVQCYVVAAETEDVDFDFTGDITAIAVNVTGTGVATRATSGANAGADATQDNDPMDAVNDLLIEISANGVASALLAYAVVYWK